MTKGEIEKLDRIWKEKVFEEYNGMSILGGLADDSHHFEKKGSIGMRFWLPNGIPLTRPQHTIIESSDVRAQGMEFGIKAIKGIEWHINLLKRKNRCSSGVKYVTYDKVFNYLSGLESDYI